MSDATDTQEETATREPQADATVELAPNEPAEAHEHGGVEGDEAAGEGDDDASEGDDESADGEGATQADATPGDGSPAKKKRKRRKKKKSGEGAQAEGGSQKPKKDLSSLPFGKYFEGGSRKHAFAPGEIVAGRVATLVDGAFAVDLFGKATAFVDAREPAEPEALPIVEAPAPEAAPEEASAAAIEGEQAPASATEGEDAAASAATESTATADAELVASQEAAENAEAALVEAEALAEASDAEVDADAETSVGTLDAPSVDHPMPTVGTIFRGRVGAVAESGHIAIVNRNLDYKAAKARIVAARNDKKRVLGLVYGFNRGGFDVLVDGVRAFCPASGLSLGPIETPDQFLGQRLEFGLPELKGGAHGIVVSRRSILERESRKRAREFAKSLKVGERVRGKVTQVRDFGFFVELGQGVEGIVHISEMSWDRGARPSDVAKVGDEVDAQIIKVPEHRKDRHERIGLSLKATQGDPWEAHTELLAEGRVFKGKITRVTDFGAFVEVAPAIDGLLHVSEFSRSEGKPNEGDEVDVIIERLDRKARRVSLSKLSPADVQAIAAGEGAANLRGPKPGSVVKFVVERIESHGIFGQIAGVVGKKGRAYLPNKESATERGADHRKIFPQGKEFEVKVTGTDRDGGLTVSRKAMLFDEEKRAVNDYRREAAKQGFGTFGDLLRAKLGDGK